LTDRGTARFVSFEGIDGCGKSTQARLLAERLRESGAEAVLTREPGGAPGAEEIRRLLVDGPPERWSAETEILLFTAARRDHWERTIAPALARGAHVVTDRFADSTRVYQGIRGDGLRATADTLHAMMIGREPDLTLVIDLAPEDAAARASGRPGAPARFESFGADYQTRLRAAFLALADEAPARIRVVNGAGPPEAVAARLREALGLAPA